MFLNMTETWAPATHCRSRPPRSPPGFSHLRSPFLNVVTWNMEHHMERDRLHHSKLFMDYKERGTWNKNIRYMDYMEHDHLEQEHHMERGHVEHGTSHGTWNVISDQIHHSCFCLSPNSLRMTAIFLPCWVVRMWVKRVVFPETKSMVDLQNDKLLFSYLSQVGQ